ncbi:hypothetical protein LM718_001451 [Campylobacter jejuni]|nr:hypothetical protein [Campylobacter jejuni]
MAVLFFLSLVVFISILMIKDDKYSKIQYEREKFIYEDFEKYTQELKSNYYILTNKIPQIIGDLIEGETKHLLLAGNNIVELKSKNDYMENFERTWDRLNLWWRYDKVEAFFEACFATFIYLIALTVLQFILIKTTNPFHLIFEFKKMFIVSILVYSILIGYGLVTYVNAEYVTLKPVSDNLELGYVPSNFIEVSDLEIFIKYVLFFSPFVLSLFFSIWLYKYKKPKKSLKTFLENWN